MDNATDSLPIACNLAAIRDAVRYGTLLERFRTAISGRAELADGYSYSVRGDRLSLTDLGEWISLERLCCPFLKFRTLGHWRGCDLVVEPHGSRGRETDSGTGVPAVSEQDRRSFRGRATATATVVGLSGSRRLWYS
jgi:hypothetical protein